MTQQIWQIERGGFVFTEMVQSFTYSTGRRTQFDSYNPGFLNITISNAALEASNFSLGNQIYINALGASGFFQYLYINEILYNDLGSTGEGSTATLVCTDLLGRLGRTQVFEQALASQGTLAQIVNEFNTLMPYGTSMVNYGNGDSTAAADAAYTGTVLNRLNQNMVTEQGWLSVTDNGIYMYSRTRIDDTAPAEITFARTTSGAFQYGYSDIKRIELGPNYLNTCTVIPPVVAQQNSENANGVATYGYYSAEFATVDNSTSQALSFAEWQVQSRDDPNELSFQITISDTNNDLTNLFDSILRNIALVNVSYKKPGSGTTFTTTQIIQGFTMSVTPVQTIMEFYTSPLTYTNFFTLNSATFGKLNTSKLGW